MCKIGIIGGEVGKAKDEGERPCEGWGPLVDCRMMLRKLLLAVGLVGVFCGGAVSAGQQDNRKVEGTVEGINFREHWAGPEVSKASDLKGKVTLLVIWGG